MTAMSDLPLDLVEEILSRVPITSLRAVRSTCKRWDDISKDPRLINKHYGKEAKEVMAVMICHSKACLISVNLHNHKDLVDSSIKQIGKLNQVNVSSVYHCDGLLLCLTDEKVLRLMVWNPYLGQIRWIRPPRNELGLRIDTYAIGYDSNNNHKILKLHFWSEEQNEIYDFKSSTWRLLGVTTDRYRCFTGVTLKGNSYLIARRSLKDSEEFLVCFDFTSETFGPRLPLPFHSVSKDDVYLSVVKEEKLAVYFSKLNKYEFGIWITTKIEHNIVSWRNFLKIHMTPLTDMYRFLCGSFFVDEKKKVAMVSYAQKKAEAANYNYKAYMVGENGYYKEVDLRENKSWRLMCSYVPSSVQISSKVPSSTCRRQKKKRKR